MQTFFPLRDPVKVFRVMDRARLGKQRVETIQILRALLGLSNGWVNHPATKMWKGYEPYLVYEYLVPSLREWKRRGYANDKCLIHLGEISFYVGPDEERIVPPWLTEEFMLRHKSMLIQKKPEHYKKYWPNTPDNLEYLWPV